MKYLMTLAVLAAFTAAGGNSSQANAAPFGRFVCTYEVQVKYWFFDTDYYHWSTYYSSKKKSAANFVFVVLKGAKNNGTLNAAAPNAYWRYIAVDVRMVKKCKYIKVGITTPVLRRPIRIRPGLKKPIRVRRNPRIKRSRRRRKVDVGRRVRRTRVHRRIPTARPRVKLRRRTRRPVRNIRRRVGTNRRVPR